MELYHRAQGAAVKQSFLGVALGVHLVVGDSFREKMRNSQRSLAEGRTRLINALVVSG
jgi:hypothetical protein